MLTFEAMHFTITLRSAAPTELLETDNGHTNDFASEVHKVHQHYRLLTAVKQQVFSLIVSLRQDSKVPSILAAVVEDTAS